MIDIHCHILAGIDDGPQRLQVSLTMAAMAAEDGIETIIATPHTDGMRVDRQAVVQGVADLTAALAEREIGLHIAAGFEIPYDLTQALAATHTLADSRYVLFELPHFYVPADALQMVFRMRDQGLVPIIAHPERNSGILADPGKLDGLVDAGALAQVTAASVTGDLGPDAQRCAHFLLSSGLVHFIATDSHSPTFRAPVLTRARAIAARLLGTGRADDLVSANPEKILHDRPWKT